MVTSDQPTDDTLRLAVIRDGLGHLHYRRFKFHSKQSLRVTSMSDVSPHAVLSKGCEEDLNVAILNWEESHRLLHVCNHPIPCTLRGNLANCYNFRFLRIGDREDIEKSIELCQNTTSESSLNYESNPDVSSCLADRLHKVQHLQT